MFKQLLIAAFLLSQAVPASARPITQQDVAFMQDRVDQAYSTVVDMCSGGGFRDRQLEICVNSAMHTIGRNIETAYDLEFTSENWVILDNAYANHNWGLGGKGQRIFGAAVDGGIKGILWFLMILAGAGLLRLFKGVRPLRFSNKPSIAPDLPDDAHEPASMRAPVARKIAGLPEFVPVVATSPATVKSETPRRPTKAPPKVPMMPSEAAPNVRPLPLTAIFACVIGLSILFVGAYGLVGVASVHSSQQAAMVH